MPVKKKSQVLLSQIPILAIRRRLMRTSFIERDSVRIMFILYFCCDDQLPLPGEHEEVYTRSIDSESKLQKIDFWIRYPDHLAAALLYGCEAGGSLERRKEEIKQIICHIFHEGEPTLRWIPMRKYLHGAYEPLDDVMNYLSSRMLAFRRVVEWGHRTRYYLTLKGCDVVEGLLKECPESIWYQERCRLIQSFFKHLKGFDLRNLQYLEKNYANTPNSEIIDRIEAIVRQRFFQLYGERLS
jgi:hypothetical protein